MRKYNLLVVIILTASVIGCDPKKEDNATLFNFNGAILKEQYHPDDNISLEILNPENKTIDSIAYYVNDVKAASVKGNGKTSFDFNGKKLGGSDRHFSTSVFFNNV